LKLGERSGTSASMRVVDARGQDEAGSVSGAKEPGTKERLVAAAGPIFARSGFEAATVREICDAAGANVAAISYHFGDKWGLYVATIDEAHCRLCDAAPIPQWPDSLAPEKKLELFVRSMVLRMMDVRRTGWPSELLTREMLNPSAASDALIERNVRPHFRGLLTILDELVVEPISPELLERIGFSIIAQCSHHRMANALLKRITSQPPERLDDLEALIAHITRFSVAAIRGYGSSDSDSRSRDPHAATSVDGATRLSGPHRRDERTGTTASIEIQGSASPRATDPPFPFEREERC
jgi:TetR/AcrR family transcriptional regulator, regulator of cefoperazone and chloramphenicol sensitivity